LPALSIKKRGSLSVYRRIDGVALVMTASRGGIISLVR
jgi:hypothetical protein